MNALPLLFIYSAYFFLKYLFSPNCHFEKRAYLYICLNIRIVETLPRHCRDTALAFVNHCSVSETLLLHLSTIAASPRHCSCICQPLQRLRDTALAFVNHCSVSETLLLHLSTIAASPRHCSCICQPLQRLRDTALAFVNHCSVSETLLLHLSTIAASPDSSSWIVMTSPSFVKEQLLIMI